MTWQIDLILFCLTKEDKVLAQMIFLFLISYQISSSPVLSKTTFLL